MQGLEFIPYGPAATLIQLGDALQPQAAAVVHWLGQRFADAAP